MTEKDMILLNSSKVLKDFVSVATPVRNLIFQQRETITHDEAICIDIVQSCAFFVMLGESWTVGVNDFRMEIIAALKAVGLDPYPVIDAIQRALDEE